MHSIAELQVLTNESQPECIGMRHLFGGDQRFDLLTFFADTCIVHEPHTENEQVIWVGGHVWSPREAESDQVSAFYDEAKYLSKMRDVNPHLFINR